MGLSQRFSDDLLAVYLRGCRTNEEAWVQHPDHPEITVSNLGGVRRRGKLLKPYPHGKGDYPTITVGGRHRHVHTLVLEAFIGPRPPGLECAHWDGKPANNRLMNLRWTTHLANMADRRRHVAERRALAYRNRPPTLLEQLRGSRPLRTTKPKRWAEIRKLLQLELEESHG